MKLHFALVMLCALGLAQAARAQTDVVPTVRIQQRLKELGFNPGSVNGRWGVRTIKALGAYQKHEGLRVDGRLTGAILERLFPPSLASIVAKPAELLDFTPIGTATVEVGTVAATPIAVPTAAGGSSLWVSTTTPSPLASEIPQPLAPPAAVATSPRISDTRFGVPSHTRPLNALGILIGAGILGGGVSLAAALGWSRRTGKKKAAPVRSGSRPPVIPDHPPVSSLEKAVAQPHPLEASLESIQASAPPEIMTPQAPASGLTEALKAYDAALKSALAGHIQPTPAMPARGEPLTIDPLPDLAAIERPAKAPAPVKTKTVAQPVQSVLTATGWLPFGQPVSLAGRVIAGGMIYVGRSLRRQNGAGNENCLINPDLPVGSRADKSGAQLSYYPAYESLTPSSRRAYVDWLASERDDPTTNIGYVFLYFYGLERRLLLDDTAAERAPLREEVQRLLTIYGSNGSFHRYATALLDAVALRGGGASVEREANPNGYQVPFPILLTLAQCIQRGDAVEATLLFEFIRCHPETRLLTPAKRAKSELAMLFTQEVEREFPKGVRLTGTAQLPPLQRTYRAASGSFEIDLLPGLKDLRDVSGLREPTATLRRIFDACTKKLDAYSRELGRAKGLTPTLEAIACLPRALRSAAVGRLTGTPLVTLDALARDHELVTPQAFRERLSLREVERVDKGVLMEWGRLLGAFGYGHTADPPFALRKLKSDGRFAVFALEAADDGAAPPGRPFRAAQATLAIGVVAAFADGAMEPSEHDSLLRVCAATPGLTVSETNRLQAELSALVADPITFADLSKLIKEIPVGERQHLARVAIQLVTADGVVDAQEVAFVEKLYRAIGLNTTELYGELHSAAAADQERATMPFLPELGAARMAHKLGGLRSGHPSSHGLDMTRIAAIRAETAGAAELLANIFQDDAPEEPALVAPDPVKTDTHDHATSETGANDSTGDGLDRRHHALLVELAERRVWPREDFDRLVRSAGLMPGAARETLNSWTLDSFDDLLFDGEDVITINHVILPAEFQRATV